MEFLASALAAVIAELGKCFCGCAFSKIENFAKFRSNLENLRREMANLIILRTSVQVIIAEAKRDGHELPNRARVNEWREQVEKLDEVVASFIEASTTNNNGETLSKYCPSCCFSCKPGLEVTRKLKDVNQLIVQGNSLRKTAAAELELRKQEVPKVQSIPGPSVQSKCLDSVLKSLNREDVNRIGVWGMGGVGKTTLVSTLNNTPSFMQPFSMVIWVTVSKQFDKRRVQIDIAKRLKLDTTMEESMEITARRIFQRLQLEEKLLLILDDVWEEVDLDRLGVQIDRPGWKLLLTSRSLDVCRNMKTDEDIKVEVLDDEESWKLFVQNAGKVVNLENIEPVSKQVARECGGLPLLINIVGRSMRGKKMFRLWEDALSEMRRSPVPNINGIHDKVYKLLKWSYDALEGTTIKSCFLFCALYPEDFSIDVKELVQSWLAEGLIDELRSYEESTNRGIALIENLKDSCLLERGYSYSADSVKMHDVVRDLASWISSSSSSEDGCKAFVRSGLGLTNFPEVETPDSVKRVSFMHNRTRNLPESVVQCPEVSTLLLQGNRSLEIVPEGFLMAFKSLKVLNLSGSCIKKLPQSLLQLRELRALLLRNCVDLEELPPLGGFTKLQVLDCHYAPSMKELPQGMEELSNLRALNISHTDALRHIQSGTLSKLSSLEFLDMSWGARWGPTRIAELACLERLTALYIDLDISGLASGSFEWIERLKRFHFIIGDPFYLSNTPYFKFERIYTEKRVTVVNLCLSGKHFGWLLNNVSTLNLFRCKELEKFPESFGSNICYSALRFLTIADYNGHFPSSNAGFCQIPNLELLKLGFVYHLESISQLASTLGLEFSKLRTIEVDCCEKLKYLFSVGGSASALEHLVSIKLLNCKELEELFAYGCSSANPLPHPIVFNLRRVDLHRLPKLEHLSGENESWNCLEELEVSECKKVWKLPLTAESAKTIKKIRGEPEWWSRLEWNDQNTKSSLQEYFTPGR